MRNVIFVAPFPLETTMRFVRAVARLAGVRLLGIVCEVPKGDDARCYTDMVRVADALDAGQLIDAARRLQARHGGIHRVVGILEPLQVQLAMVREALGVPGARPDVAELFRDKGRMKDALRAHGLPCARHAVLRNWEDAARFVAEVGFPLVIKPTAGMGCKATWRIRDADQLREAMGAMHVSPQHPAIAEEFLVGREYSLETITVGGKVRFVSGTKYLPTPLDVMENPWIQWVVVHPRSIDDPAFTAAQALAVRAVEALGLETGMTHMEWFERSDGSLAIGEIAARPPGAHIVSGNNYVHDADLHRAWARAVVDEAFDGPYTRKWSVGVVFLRDAGRGRVARITGVDAANARVSSLVVESRLPRIGTPKSDSYEGDGLVVVRHPDTRVVEDACRFLIQTLQVHYA